MPLGAYIHIWQLTHSRYEYGNGVSEGLKRTRYEFGESWGLISFSDHWLGMIRGAYRCIYTRSRPQLGAFDTGQVPSPLRLLRGLL